MEKNNYFDSYTNTVLGEQEIKLRQRRCRKYFGGDPWRVERRQQVTKSQVPRTNPRSFRTRFFDYIDRFRGGRRTYGGGKSKGGQNRQNKN